jgi:hypothetical protein
MLNYNILTTSGDTSIIIPISMDNNPKNHDENDDLATAVAKASINPIVNREKDGFAPASPYKIQFNFIQGGIYYTWQAAGFDMPGDLNKNIFKKSEFLIEFYDTNSQANNLLFSTTLGIYPNKASAKGADSDLDGNTLTVYTTFTVSEIRNELYLLFFNRDFDSLSNVLTDTNGRYVKLYMKVMFLNAKTGNVHYFFEDTKYTPLDSASFVPTIYYNEIRFYENLTYAFFRNGTQVTSLNYNEIYIRS